MTDYQITATDHGDAATLNGGDPVEILVTIPSGGGGGGGAVDSVNGETGVVVLSAADVGAQPVDSDLTAIAALTTTTFGRSLLALADAAALRTSAGLGTAATQATSAFDAAGAASSAQAASQPLDSDLTAIAALTTTSFGRSLLTAADAAAARVLTGAGTSSLALGTSSSTAKAGDYQPAAANISDATTIGKSVLTAADAAAVRTAIGAGTSSFDGVYASLTSKPTLGTAAAKDVPASGDASSSQVVYGTDTRLTDARTPTTHSHAESDVTSLVADLAAKVPTTRTVAGHALSADVTLVKGDVGLGNVDNTADASKTFTESQVTNLTTDLAAKAPTSRTLTAGTGLTGGGTLAADRTFTVAYGTSSTTAAVGNDSRLSDARTPTTHASSHAAGGSDPVALDDSQVAPVTPNDQTGTTYTFVLADKHRLVTGSNASAQTFTIPPNSSVAYPLGTSLQVYNKGAGLVTLAAGSGVTIRTPRGAKIAVQYGLAQAVQVVADTWVIAGDVTT